MQGDQRLCQRHTGVEGGSDAARLGAFPILSEVHSHFRSERAGSVLLLVAGDDGVVMQALSALGAFADDGQFQNECQRMPVGSRVTFEHWRERHGENAWW